MTRPRPLNITDTIFDELADQTQFDRHIRVHHRHFCYKFAFEPVLSEDRLSLVYQAYANEKEQLKTRLPESSHTPDHFKLAGMLVFWLRRFAIVYEMHSLTVSPQATEKYVSLLEQYASELPAFELGIALCDFFEQSKRSKEKEIIPAIDLDYLKAICYMMRFKNVSPHAMGMIYKSLYVPLTIPENSSGQHIGD